MTNEEFMLEVDRSVLRSKRVLLKKEREYSSDKDRLEQFYRAGAAQAVSPTEALIGMATKHFTSIADMAKNPRVYTRKQWNAKVVDLRNYTFLLDGLLTDLEVE